MKHEEANLHLSFCKWVKSTYPQDNFIRHEREGKRSLYMQNLFKVYNNGIDKLPDFEALIRNDQYSGFYIEFKKPGEKWLLKDCKTVKPQYAGQYKTHHELKKLGRALYFSNDLEHAKSLYIAFKENRTLPMQEYELPIDKTELAADEFLTQYGV